MPNRRVATASEREAGAALHTQYARELQTPHHARPAAPNDSCGVPGHVRLIASGSIVSYPEVVRTLLLINRDFTSNRVVSVNARFRQLPVAHLIREETF